MQTVNNSSHAIPLHHVLLILLSIIFIIYIPWVSKTVFKTVLHERLFLSNNGFSGAVIFDDFSGSNEQRPWSYGFNMAR